MRLAGEAKPFELVFMVSLESVWYINSNSDFNSENNGYRTSTRWFPHEKMLLFLACFYPELRSSTRKAELYDGFSDPGFKQADIAIVFGKGLKYAEISDG